MPTIRFLGAAQTVTGSRFLVDSNGYRFLIDCGLFQGGRALKERNWQPFPVPPDSIDAVVLTHAHIDHSGYLPRLIKDGFRGPVYCTAATADLLSLLLPDSGHLQEEDAAFANKKRYSRHDPALPLYTEAEAREVLKYLHPVPYHHLHELCPGLSFEYLHAGHILGSAMVRVRHAENGTTKVGFFTGDLGRYGQPIIKDPQTIAAADYLVIESTYGDRTHQKLEISEFLRDLINKTVKGGGSLVIPAFAIGRSQRIIYLIRQLEMAQKIPSLPIFLDSPMAVSAVSIYCSHPEEHDFEMAQLMSEASPLETGAVRLVRSVEQSKALNEFEAPSIIISASGNLAGGRILHHLKTRLRDHRNTVLFVGYQSRGSLGRLIVEGRKKVKIHGTQIAVRARVVALEALSAHADAEDIRRWVGHIKQPPSWIFLVHGEPPAQEALKAKLQEAVPSKIEIPDYLWQTELEF